MENIVLVIHLILALALIGLILLQRSEGGGLGIGGGGLGGFASAGQTANALTRATAFCAAAFFVTSLILAILAGTHHKAGSMLDSLDKPAGVVDSVPAPSDKDLPKASDKLVPQQNGAAPTAPISQ